MNEGTAATVDRAGFNERFLQAVTQFSDWSKHLITIAAGVLVLGATLLKDVVSSAADPLRLPIVLALGLSYVFLLASIWKGLKFISVAAGTILTEADVVVTGEDLGRLQKLLRLTQRLSLAGILCFALLACLALASWTIGDHG